MLFCIIKIFFLINAIKNIACLEVKAFDCVRTNHPHRVALALASNFAAVRLLSLAQIRCYKDFAKKPTGATVGFSWQLVGAERFELPTLSV